MGTNFYLHRIPSESDIQRMHELVNKQKFISNWDEDNYDDSLSSMVKWFSNYSIHLGKRSGGWQFTFDHGNGVYYQPNRESINEFIMTPNMKIVDEYGETYTPEQFWKLVDEWNANPSNDMTSEKYSRTHPGESCNYFDAEQEFVKKTFGIYTKYGDFKSDGLTFAVYTNFS